MTGLCKNCKSWGWMKARISVKYGALCLHDLVGLDSSSAKPRNAAISAGGDASGFVSTGPDFGCVHFEDASKEDEKGKSDG